MHATLRGVSWFAALLVLSVSTGGPGDAAAPAGTKIVNQATATYQSAKGTSFGSSSNVVTTVVADVASLSVGPQDPGCTATSDVVALDGRFTRTFVVTNTSNGPDSFTIASASASAGAIVGMAWIAANGSASPAQVGGAPSSVVSPGGTLFVALTVNDAGVAAGTKLVVSLTVRTTAKSSNGAVSASAQQCGLLTAPPVLSGSGPGNAVLKTVDGQTIVEAHGAETVTYAVAFKNSGGSVATHVVVTDPVPAYVTPVASSVTVDGKAAAAHVSGSTLTIDVGDVAIGASVTIAFDATVAGDAPTGASLVNTASISATGLATSRTDPAVVLIGTANVVYDGDVGSAAPIADAVVTIMDAHANAHVRLTGTAIAPNVDDDDPWTTGANGVYAFGLAVPKSVTTYVVTVTAPGYISRKLQLTLTPDATGTLYAVMLTSLDGQPLATPGGFPLDAGPVGLTAVYGFFGNIPMFKPHAISVTKTVDSATASGGSRLVYTLTVANGASALGATTVVDELPPSVAYAARTARVDGVAVEPIVSGTHLTWSFSALDKEHEIEFATVVLPNVEEGATLVNAVIANAAIPGSKGFFATGRAQAQTIIVPGVFSDRIPITGRVFLDIAATGRFVKGDVGVPGVRVWLEDGESVVTDNGGRYDFPATRPGMHVLHVDRDTLPAGVTFFPTQAYDSERSAIQLVHGPFDGGLLQDVNFALRPPVAHT